jgi:hypothetical protein
MVKHRSGTRWPDDREVGWRRVQCVLCTRRQEARVSLLSLKTKIDGFPIWPSKLIAPVWWFSPQNNCDGFLVCASKSSGLRFVSCTIKSTGGWFDAGHASRSGSLLRLEASYGRVFQTALRTGGGATMSGAHDIIMEIALSGGWRRIVDVMSCVGPFYPKIVVFYVLGHTGKIVF